MPRVPETRASLILRLPSAEDGDAWQEFVSIYEPFVYRFAIRGGLQDADAKELVQNVMLSVAKAVGRGRPDSKRAKFRTWLFRIARNQLLDELSKQTRQTVARGGSSFVGLLNQFAAATGSAEQQMRLEHRRSLVVQATRRSL
ncbi:MAG: sigma-70 family RNA polymerase sigma factor [Fuerstiella sp.]